METISDNLIIETTKEDSDNSPIDTQFTSILETVSLFKSQITLITVQLKTLEKVIKKEVKQKAKAPSLPPPQREDCLLN